MSGVSVHSALVVAWAALAIGGGPVVRAEPVLVYPGMEIRQDSHVCTLGYVDSRLRVAFSAGHCRGNGTVTDREGNGIGAVVTFRDNTPDGATVNTDEVIADYESIALDEAVAPNDVLPGGRRLESGAGPVLAPGDPVCHFGIVSGESCGSVEQVNNGWFTMSHGVTSQRGDSGGPVYTIGDAGSARIVGLFNSVWGEYPAAVSWSAISRQVREDAATS